jgi:hypothetical protein
MSEKSENKKPRHIDEVILENWQICLAAKIITPEEVLGWFNAGYISKGEKFKLLG